MGGASSGTVRPTPTGTFPSSCEVLCWAEISAESALSGAGGCGFQYDARTVAQRDCHFNTHTEEGYAGCAGEWRSMFTADEYSVE